MSRAAARWAAAVDLGGSAIKAALVRGKVVSARREAPTPRNGTSKQILEAIGREVEALLSEARARKIRVSGIGLGTPGLVDPAGKILGSCPNLPKWVGTPAGRLLARRFRMPAAVANDANLAALGEAAHGAARGARSAVLLTLGTGIGGGVVLDGKLFAGGRGLGAELGHVTIDRNGPDCGCGGKGCLEQYASAKSILRRYNEIRNPKPGTRNPGPGTRAPDPGPRDVREVFALARRGDRAAKAAVGEGIEALGLALAGLANAFNPEVLILGGGMSRIPGFVAAAAKVARSRAIPECMAGVRIVPAELGNDAGLVGAAAFALQTR